MPLMDLSLVIPNLKWSICQLPDNTNISVKFSEFFNQESGDNELLILSRYLDISSHRRFCGENIWSMSEKSSQWEKGHLHNISTKTPNFSQQYG